MITFFVENCNHLSQDFYDSFLNRLQFHRLKCSCGHSGCLTVHGYYKRKVKAHGGSFMLTVCRVICSECGKTHAILPSSIVPYSQLPLVCQCLIIAACRNGCDATTICEEYPDVDENNIKHVIRNYRRHWKERLLSVGISLLPATLLVRECFAHYSAQFMQIHRTVNTFFSNPT